MERINSNVNSKLLTLLYILGFIISGSFTALCLVTMGHSNWSKLLLIGMTIIFEFAKGISFFEFLSGKHAAKISKLWFVVWIVLMGFSLFASTAFSMNETSKSKNESYKNSSAFKNSVDEQKRMENLIGSKEKQIEKAIKEKEKNIKAMEKERDSLPEGYIRRKQQATADITKYSNNQQSKIDKYYSQLEDLNDELDKKSKITSDNYETEATSGYITILTVAADFLNNSGIYFKNKWTFEELELLFYFLLSFTLEIVICLFYYLKKYNEVNDISQNEQSKLNEIKIIGDKEERELKQGKKNNKDFRLNNRKFRLLTYPKENKSEQSKENSKSKDTKNQIGFKMDSNIYVNDPDDIKEYLLFGYENKNGNLSQGQKKINDTTGLSFKKIKNIKNMLEEKGILKTDDKSTYVLVDSLSEAFEKLETAKGDGEKL